MNITFPPLIALLLFPGGLFLLSSGLIFEYVDRKLIARFQNRIGPRWFQPLADVIKLLAKEEVMPSGVNALLFVLLPIVALTAALTAALSVPLFGFKPVSSFSGDLVVTLYLLSLMTLCIGLAGANTEDRFSLIGATRALTQLFSYEAPFLLALLGPAISFGTWNISEINQGATTGIWFIISQPIGFLVALVGLMGKLELPPFDAPEAETEIVAGALTEYSGRGFAIFKIGRDVELVIGLTLIASFYLGGFTSPLDFLWKTVLLLLVTATLQSLFARLRIDQTVGLWWRIGVILVLLQLVVIVAGRYLSPAIQPLLQSITGG
ncbi:MAG: NADH-quinone oxidoreductase subunit H [Chloroflexi bacterium]|nr:NADH-quinone oxidoreductase subunit H [Chloroflexota bacterium]